MKRLINHPEFKVQSLNSAFACLKDEVIEFIDKPSFDEASDIAFAINRMAGSLVGLKYIPVLPFLDILHIRKKLKRINEYGHFRSRRALGLKEGEKWTLKF